MRFIRQRGFQVWWITTWKRCFCKVVWFQLKNLHFELKIAVRVSVPRIFSSLGFSGDAFIRNNLSEMIQDGSKQLPHHVIRTNNVRFKETLQTFRLFLEMTLVEIWESKLSCFVSPISRSMQDMSRLMEKSCCSLNCFILQNFYFKNSNVFSSQFHFFFNIIFIFLLFYLFAQIFRGFFSKLCQDSVFSPLEILNYRETLVPIVIFFFFWGRQTFICLKFDFSLFP